MPGVHWQAVMMAQGTLDSSQAHGRPEFLAPELDLAQSLQAFGEMNLPLSLSLFLSLYCLPSIPHRRKLIYKVSRAYLSYH